MRILAKASIASDIALIQLITIQLTCNIKRGITLHMYFYTLFLLLLKRAYEIHRIRLRYFPIIVSAQKTAQECQQNMIDFVPVFTQSALGFSVGGQSCNLDRTSLVSCLL